jgi:Fur family ferric uptake transcriptional regulator
MTELNAFLRKHGLRVTSPRKDVFRALESAVEPLSMQQIIKQCPGVDRVSVYRCLETFETIGIIEVIHVGWKKRYELAGPFKAHHHHLQCVRCHALVDLHSAELETLIANTASLHGYKPLSHHFEVRGLCPNCQAVKS